MNYNIQRWLTIISVSKCLWLLQVALQYYTCPWDTENTLVYVSIFADQILSILTVICSSTIINSLFYMISLGWGTTLHSIERGIVTNVMIVGGSLYLLQLAKNYSGQEQSLFPVIFDSFLAIEYTILLRLTFMQSTEQLTKMENIRDHAEELVPAAFMPSF